MLESRIVAVDHVILEAPPEAENELRWFYGELATLDEVVAAAEWGRQIVFKSLRIELRIHLRENPRVDPIVCRLTVRVPLLDEVIEQLEDRKIEFVPISGIRWTDRRITLLDPGGNRVELRKDWPMVVL